MSAVLEHTQRPHCATAFTVEYAMEVLIRMGAMGVSTTFGMFQA